MIVNPNVTAENSVVQIFNDKWDAIWYKTIPKWMGKEFLEFDTNKKMFQIWNKSYHLTAGDRVRKKLENLWEMTKEEFQWLQSK